MMMTSVSVLNFNLKVLLVSFTEKKSLRPTMQTLLLFPCRKQQLKGVSKNCYSEFCRQNPLIVQESKPIFWFKVYQEEVCHKK